MGFQARFRWFLLLLSPEMPASIPRTKLRHKGFLWNHSRYEESTLDPAADDGFRLALKQFQATVRGF